MEVENAMPPRITNFVFLNRSNRAEPIAPDSEPIAVSYTHLTLPTILRV